jgi:hypothetical protein
MKTIRNKTIKSIGIGVTILLVLTAFISMGAAQGSTVTGKVTRIDHDPDGNWPMDATVGLDTNGDGVEDWSLEFGGMTQSQHDTLELARTAGHRVKISYIIDPITKKYKIQDVVDLDQYVPNYPNDPSLYRGELYNYGNNVIVE